MAWGFLVLRSNWKNAGKPPNCDVPMGVPLESKLGVEGGFVLGAVGNGGKLVLSPLNRGSVARDVTGSPATPKALFADESKRKVFWSRPKLAPPPMRSWSIAPPRRIVVLRSPRMLPSSPPRNAGLYAKPRRGPKSV